MENEEIGFVKFSNRTIHIPKDIILKESENALLKSLMVSQIGIYNKASGHRVNNRLTDDYIFIYCIDGKGFLEINNTLYNILEGDIFFCEKDKYHSYSADVVEPWTILWAHFSGDSVLYLLSLLSNNPEIPVLHIGDEQRIKFLFNEILDTLTNGYSFCNMLYSSTCLQNIFGYIIKLRNNSDSKSRKDFDIDSVISFMLNNITKSFKLKDFSDFSNMSLYHFSRKFKEKTLYSPIDYFIRLKIQKACEILDNTNMRINEISAFLGYDNPYFFSLVFKKIVGISPNAYRKIQKG